MVAGGGACVVTGGTAEEAGLVAVCNVVGTAVVAGLVTEATGAGAEPDPATVKSTQDS